MRKSKRESNSFSKDGENHSFLSPFSLSYMASVAPAAATVAVRAHIVTQRVSSGSDAAAMAIVLAAVAHCIKKKG